MAITDVVPGVEVAITVRGNDLKEYRDNELDEEVSTTTRYVEAASGQTFEVRLKVKPNFRFLGDTLAFEILVDGNWMETPLIDKQQCGGLGYQRIIRGVTTSARTLRRFQFATLDPGASQLSRVFQLANMLKSQRRACRERRRDTLQASWHHQRAGDAAVEGRTVEGLCRCEYDRAWHRV